MAGPTSGLIAGLVVAAAVLALFARRELSIADPILDIRLFANRYFCHGRGYDQRRVLRLIRIHLPISLVLPGRAVAVRSSRVRILPFAIVMAVFSPDRE